MTQQLTTMQQAEPTVNEADAMDAHLAVLRSRERAEVADLDAGMDYETWREVYGLDNTPGYAERHGRF